jgi:hypothetical protein
VCNFSFCLFSDDFSFLNFRAASAPCFCYYYIIGSVCCCVHLHLTTNSWIFPPHPSLIVIFFLQKNKTKQKWICYYRASVCESDCLKYFCFLWEIALECRQKQSNGYRLLIIMVRNPTLPAIFFFCVCVCDRVRMFGHVIKYIQTELKIKF